jgi:uncharacterized protein YutE (UPF0331/DUF86 family)
MDRERILSKLDTLEEYLEQLHAIKPQSFEEYTAMLEKKMSCERLLHLLIETTMDTCYLLVKELKLGLPAGDESAIQKLSGVFSPALVEKLRGMKRLRNILVHRYDEILDDRIFAILEQNLDDFRVFKRETITALERVTKK